MDPRRAFLVAILVLAPPRSSFSFRVHAPGSPRGRAVSSHAVFRFDDAVQESEWDFGEIYVPRPRR